MNFQGFAICVDVKGEGTMEGELEKRTGAFEGVAVLMTSQLRTEAWKIVCDAHHNAL